MSEFNARDVKPTVSHTTAERIFPCFLLKRFDPSAVAGLVAMFVLIACAGPAHADPTDDWSDTFLLQGAGFENPLVRVGFNPCPEPPGKLVSNPTRPLVSVPGSANPFQILFGIAGVGPVTIDAPGEPDAFGDFNFQILSGGVTNTPVVLFNVLFEMTTDSGGVPDARSWQAFLPDVLAPFPGRAADAAQIGFDFNYSSLSTAFLSMQITDANGGNPLSFTAVPAPPTLALIGMGIVWVAGIAHRRRRRRPR